jgi:malonate-semialdehyde dehydrogenase (acetylating) / methylmalonate-semialdehyde dehydrogenase
VSFVQLPREPKILENLVGGRWARPAGAALLDVTSPYTGTLIGKVPMSSAADVGAIVDEARRAQPAWAAMPIKERTARLFRFRQLLLDNLERLANSAASESGKLVAEAQASVLKGVEVCEFALSLQNMDQGGIMEVSRGITCEYRREPLGVVAGIAPFNFPAMVPMWMFPIAVTLGNAFILKPSEKVPMTTQLVGELMVEAGFPPGIFSIAHGGREAVEALLAHPDVKAIGFVGSTQVARSVYETGTRNGKRVLALGGAKNHLIMVPDADEALTVPAVVDSFTGCAGQRCMAASVLLAVGDVDHLVQKIIARAASIQLGTGMGAIIDQGSLDRISSAIAAAEQAGAKLVLDGRGKRPEGDEYKGGSWLGPSILDHVSPSMDLRTREVFGPVLAIVRVPTLREALAVQHDCAYGNACSVFTTTGSTAQYVAHNAHAGMIGVNVGVPVPREPFSFGGINDSRFGQGDITGPGGVEFWSQQKKVTTKWAVQPDTTWMG